MSKRLRALAEAGDVAGVQEALEMGHDPNWSGGKALTAAVISGKIEVVRLLLEAGANPLANDTEALCQAARHGKTEIVALLIDDLRRFNGAVTKSRALEEACQGGETETAKVLLEAGADPCRNNHRAFALAELNGWSQTLSEILKKTPSAGLRELISHGRFGSEGAKMELHRRRRKEKREQRDQLEPAL